MANDSGATGSGGVAGQPEGGIDLSGGVAEATLGVTGAGRGLEELVEQLDAMAFGAQRERLLGSQPRYTAERWGREWAVVAHAGSERSSITFVTPLRADAEHVACTLNYMVIHGKRYPDDADALSSPAGTKPAEHTPGTAGMEARRDSRGEAEAAAGATFVPGPGVEIRKPASPLTTIQGITPCEACGGSGFSKVQDRGRPLLCSCCRPHEGPVVDAVPSGEQSQRTLNATLDAVRRSPIAGVDVRA